MLAFDVRKVMNGKQSLVLLYVFTALYARHQGGYMETGRRLQASVFYNPFKALRLVEVVFLRV
jgi:hypothetical protein